MDREHRKFEKRELEQMDTADDLKVSPFRADGITYGTPTWIWSVIVDGELFVRAYNGHNSRWYQAAMQQKAGRIHAAGLVKEVHFEAENDTGINSRIDAAYRIKYSTSPYLAPMIGSTAKSATVRITPV